MDARTSGPFLASSLATELKQGMRRLPRLPAFSVSVVLTLALPIAASAVVLSLVHCILLSPLPYPDSDRLVGLWMVSPAFANNTRIRQSPATYLHFGGESRAFDSLALAEPQTFTLDDGIRADRLQGALVTPLIHQVLGVPVEHGRAIDAADTLPGAEPVVVLSHGLWVERFGRDPEALSRFLKVDHKQHRVIGVLPPGLAFPAADTRLWLPLTIDPAAPTPLRFRYSGYGRLAEGVDPDAARQDLDRLIHTLPDAYPGGFSREVIEQAEITARVRQLKEEIVGDVRPALRIFLVSVFAVLVMATANLLNLFAARTESRQRELAIRSALGASRGSLLASIALEGLWLTALGTALGLGLGTLAVKGLQLLAPADLPRLQEVRLDLWVVAVTTGVSIVVGLLAGLLPAWGALPHSLVLRLRGASVRTGGRAHRLMLRQALVSLQVAVALVLVVACGLLVHSYRSLLKIDPGFVSEDVLTLRIALPEIGYEDWSQDVSFFHRLLDRVRTLPGVEGAAAASSLPLRDGQTVVPYRVESDQNADEAVRPTAQALLVSEDYLSTLQVPMVEGRGIERRDAETGAPVAVVNEAFARHHWAGRSALGQRLLPGSAETWLTVVGVVKDVHDRSLVETPAPILYLPLAGPEGGYQFAGKELSLAVRSSRATALTAEIRTVIARMDREVPVYDVRPLDRVLGAASMRARWTAFLLIGAALGALFLAVVGLSGLMAYTVSRRQREIGIRMALGASRRRIRSMVTAQALVLTGAGIAAGTVGALFLGRLLSSQLYQVSPREPLVLLSAVGLLSAVAWLAADLPARRASRLDPAATVRGEQ